MKASRPRRRSLSTRSMVKIILKNHHEVAKKHSSFADVAATLAPNFLRRKVEADFVKQLRQHLIEHGILAEISIEPDPSPKSPG